MTKSNPIKNVLISQSLADARLSRATSSYRRSSLRNAVALGKQITLMRKQAGVPRGMAARALGVSSNSLYLAENPARGARVIQPETQAKYFDAVNTFTEGVLEAATRVKFKRSARGRPRMAA